MKQLFYFRYLSNKYHFIFHTILSLISVLCLNQISIAQSDLSPANSSNEQKTSAAFSIAEKSMGQAGIIDPMVTMDETGTFELGYEFTVKFPITITELGFYDLSADGLVGVTPVTIWSSVDHTAILTIDIPSGVEASMIDGFRYANIPDLRLDSGTYLISAFITEEEYGMNLGFTAQTVQGIEINAGVYSINHEYPGNYNNSFGFFGPNFLFVADKPAVIDMLTTSEGTGTYELGCSFTVNSPILVTQLGTYDSNGDGLVVETPVTIWRASDQSVVTTANIPAGEAAPLINNFRYVTVDSFYLEPGEYRMSSYLVNETYARNNALTSISAPEITLNLGVYNAVHAYPVTTYSVFYFGANFIFTNPLAAITNPAITSGSSGTWELGYQFEVLNTITLTELGTYDRYDDGIIETIVTIWDTTSKAAILCDTIPAGTTAPLINGFRYVDIPDFTLLPGFYRISSYFIGDNFAWNSSLTSTSISEINLICGVYRESSAQGYPASVDDFYYFGPNFLVRQACQVSDLPIIDGSSVLCTGDSTVLSIATGDLNSSVNWHWYADSCDGGSLGTEDSVLVKPAASTIYYVRGEGNCLENGPCAAFLVKIVDHASISRDENTLIASIEGAEYQWLDCNDGNAPISGETGQSFSPDEDGDYAVLVTIRDCELVSNCRHIILTGIHQNTIGEGLIVYPNPVNDVLTIELPGVYTLTVVEILNLSGKTVMNESFNMTPLLKLDIASFDQGLYFLRIYADDKIATLKIFKK